MASTKRHDGRKADELRAVRITTPFVGSADGSCLIEMGRTRVICTACFVPGVPEWRKGSGKGWMTAEYGMLPASTRTRKARPLAKPDGRGVEIQRLIGRVLRMVLRLDKLGENTVHLDCDVLEADGGTRTAAITGSYVALAQAVGEAARRGACAATALSGRVAAVSVGIVDGRALLDLDYAEDSRAEVDLNLAMTAGGKFIEVQATAERAAFDAGRLQQMLRQGGRGIRRLLAEQSKALRAAAARHR